MDALFALTLRDWRIGISHGPYNNVYWLFKEEGGKPLESWYHEKLLGRGGFGEVWRARCTFGEKNLKQLRAVKIINKRRAGFPKSSQREIQALGTFSGEEYRDHFVQFFGWYEDNAHLYLAMEYIKYGDLQQYIDGLAPFPEPTVAGIAKQVAQALKYMHSQGFIHRDIKPQNILVVSKERPNWHVKVSDFGIARDVEGGDSFFTHYIGTRGYMAPELFKMSSSAGPRSYTAAVDVWALGAVVFCLLTGEPPFESLDDLFVFSKGLVQFPTGELGASTGFCIDFVLGAMDPNPTRRWSIDHILAHQWLTLDGRGVFNLSFLQQRALSTMGNAGRLFTASPSPSSTARGQSTPTAKGSTFHHTGYLEYSDDETVREEPVRLSAKDRMKIMKKERQERMDEETRSWERFVGHDMRYMNEYKPVDLEETCYFIQRLERVTEREERQRVRKALREAEEKQRLKNVIEF